jgi:prepilin-type processing-associated H-X9-DG protein
MLSRRSTNGQFTIDICMNTSPPPAREPTRGHPNQETAAAAAFSQVDLLTVIVVLMLLGLLLSPALARTRVTDQTLQCRNNLRQLIHGWRLYAEDNNGKLPNSFEWVGGYLDYSANNPDNTNINYLIHGLLGPYVTNPAVYKCPADQSQAIENGGKYPRVRTYSMSQSFCNANEGWLEYGDSPQNYWRHYLKTTDMVAPSPVNLWVLLDESPDSVNDGAFGVAMSGNDPTRNKWQDGPITLHDSGCSFAFADGHYEIKKWTDPRTIALKVTYTTRFTYGILQANNNDIQWVKDRTTAPK